MREIAENKTIRKEVLIKLLWLNIVIVVETADGAFPSYLPRRNTVPKPFLFWAF